MNKQKLECPYCGAPAKLQDSSVVYGEKNGKLVSHGFIWICPNYPECDSYVGCHRGSTEPIGIMANSEGRHWRQKAHKRFDDLWKTGDMTRQESYLWLGKVMNKNMEEAHIGRFTTQECKDLIKIIDKMGL